MFSSNRAKRLSRTFPAIGVLAVSVVLIGGLSLSDPSGPASAAQSSAVAFVDQTPAAATPELQPEPDRNIPTIEPAPLPDGPVQRTDGPLKRSPKPLAPPIRS